MSHIQEAQEIVDRKVEISPDVRTTVKSLTRGMQNDDCLILAFQIALRNLLAAFSSLVMTRIKDIPVVPYEGNTNAIRRQAFVPVRHGTSIFPSDPARFPRHPRYRPHDSTHLAIMFRQDLQRQSWKCVRTNRVLGMQALRMRAARAMQQNYVMLGLAGALVRCTCSLARRSWNLPCRSGDAGGQLVLFRDRLEVKNLNGHQ